MAITGLLAELRVTAAVMPAGLWITDLGSSYEPVRGSEMDSDRIAGAAKHVKGSIKEAIGKLTGNTKIQTEGAAEKVEGKVQNTAGGAKDVVRDAADK
jgi:uncharacterized protein YjbJ (UPF0337 family)